MARKIKRASKTKTHSPGRTQSASTPAVLIEPIIGPDAKPLAPELVDIRPGDRDFLALLDSAVSLSTTPAPSDDDYEQREREGVWRLDQLAKSLAAVQARELERRKAAREKREAAAAQVAKEKNGTGRTRKNTAHDVNQDANSRALGVAGRVGRGKPGLGDGDVEES